MKRANTTHTPGTQNDHQAMYDDFTHKGRYQKSVLLTTQQGLPSSSTLAPAFLRSFGFAKNTAAESDAGMFTST